MRTIDELEDGWKARSSPPRDAGSVRLLCVRRASGVHETPASVMITAAGGLAGDRWANRGAGKDPDGASAVTLKSAAVAELVTAGEQPLHMAGDNILVDLDISVEALPPGSRLAVGDAILRVSEQPHNGCSTYRDRFGIDALKWVSTPEGRARRLRGMNCSVVRDGIVRVGDPIEVLEGAPSPEPDEASSLV